MRLPSKLELAAIVVATISPAVAEAADDATKKPAAKITYVDHIEPLFRSKCFRCHNQDRKKGDLAVDTFAALMEGGSSGAVVQLGDPDASRIVTLIERIEEPHMPPRGDKLPDADLAMVRSWVEAGAPETKSSKVRVAKPKIDLTVNASAAERPPGPPPVPRGLTLEPAVHTARADAVTAMAANPWAPVVAVAGQRQVLLWDTTAFELLGVLAFPEGTPQILKFSRNGALLLAGGGRGAHSGKVVLWDARSGERVTEIGNEVDSVLAADISSDHSLVALGSSSKMLRVYSTSDGELLWEKKKHTDWIYAIEFSPDGVLLASADRAGGLWIWESLGGREYLNLRGHSGAVTDVSWRIDSNLLASAGEDATVRLWELENGRQVKRWNAHGGGTLAVEFYRDGRLATAGRDRTAKLWDQNGALKRAFEAFGDVALEVAVAHDGATVIGGGWNGEVRMWNATDGKRLASLATNPPTLAMRLDAARGRHAELKEAHDASAAEIASLRSAHDKAQQDLAAVREAVRRASAAVDAARENGDASREAADAASRALAATLTDLTAKERAFAEATSAAGKPDAAEKIAAAKGALTSAQKTAAAHTAEVKTAIDARVAAHTALGKARAKQASTAGSIAALEKRVGETAPLLTAKQRAVADAATRLARGELVVRRWTAAQRLAAALRALAERRRELALATEALEEAEAALAQHGEKQAQIAARAQSDTEAARVALAAVATAAKSLAAQAEPAADSASTAAAGLKAAGAQQQDEGALAIAKGKLGELRKATAALSAAIDETTGKWRDLCANADAAATRAQATLDQLATARAEQASRAAQTIELRQRVEAARKTVDAARATVAKEVEASEEARAAAR